MTEHTQQPTVLIARDKNRLCQETNSYVCLGAYAAGFAFLVRYELIHSNTKTFFSRKEKTIKANIFSKMLLFIITAIVCSFAVGSFYAQSDPSREILVYFASGIERAPAGQPAAIHSAAIQRMLTRFSIDQSQLISAFPNFNEADTLKRLGDGRTISFPNMARIFKIQVPASISREEVIDSLKKLPGVLFAEPNFHDYRAHGFPDDPHYQNGDQWGLYNYGQNGGTNRADIHAPETWQITTGSNVLIGVIDNGVDAGHEDLAGKVGGDAGVYGGNQNWAFGHGTHVSGIAAAIGNNTKGIAGVNWAATINSQRIENGSDQDFYNGIMDAVNAGSKILNNSWGGSSYSTTIRMAFANAYKSNVVAVASMGNDNTSNISYPAGYGQGIISVGATTRNDVRWVWNSYQGSNYGNHIDVVAPGDQIWSSIPYTNQYDSWTGTSMAAPFVSGISSLMLSVNPNLYNDDIEHIIQLSADKVRTDLYTYDLNGWNVEMGYGRVNAYNALNFLRSPYILDQLSASGETDYYKGPATTMAIYGASGLADGVYITYMHEVRTTVNFSYRANPNVWGRGVATIGWSAENPNFGMGYCNVVPGTVTNTSATLYTYVYEIYTTSGGWVGWYPTTPANTSFGYSVLGTVAPLSASISGPTSLGIGQNGTWNASVAGGYSPYSYQWYYEYPGGILPAGAISPNLPPKGVWYTIGTNSASLTAAFYSSIYLKCVVTDAHNTVVTSNILSITIGAAKINTDQSNATVTPVPIFFAMEQNYPNPFNPSTEIRFALPEPGYVKLIVYDMLGREVARLADGYMDQGYHNLIWSAGNIASGIYIYRLSAGSFVQEKRMVLMK